MGGRRTLAGLLGHVVKFREWLAWAHPDVTLNAWQDGMVTFLEGGDDTMFAVAPRRAGKTFLFNLWVEYLETQ